MDSQIGMSFELADLTASFELAAKYLICIKIDLSYEEYAEVIEVYLGPKDSMKLVDWIIWRSAATGKVVVDYPHRPGISRHHTAETALYFTLKKAGLDPI